MIGALVGVAVPASAGATVSRHGCYCQTTTAPTTTTEVTTTTAATTTSVGAVTTIVTTTTRPHVTTTTRPRVTTTVHQQIVTTTTTPSPTSMRFTTTTSPGNHKLPRTGSDVFFPLMFGLCCLAAGALLMLRRYRGWRTSS